MPRDLSRRQSKGVPEWSSEQIIRARKVHRAGGTLEEALAAAGGVLLGRSSGRQRLARYGMRFGKGSAHAGTSKSVEGALEAAPWKPPHATARTKVNA